MASMVPDEGLDLILGQFPFNTAKYTSPLKLKLFTSQTATTVVTHAQALANVTETTYTSYAQQDLAAATWGAATEITGNLGRQMTYPQVTFPTVGATPGSAINGFYITNNGATVLIVQANFDDLTAIPIQTGDVVKVTPTFGYSHPT